MNTLLGLIFLSIGLVILIYAFKNNRRLKEELEEFESDLGVSYYKIWFAGIFFTIAGILVFFNFISLSF
ncbi:hypothetical protein SCB49_14560 [unidentified eubacterium SCB49]|nr:hypothetical protein SCB49_14560 [unidentified eubacterium SCB49]